jgi:hypothetical protein
MWQEEEEEAEGRRRKRWSIRRIRRTKRRGKKRFIRLK